MIFTADKERDIIDKLTAENRILKEQIENLQSELETKKENEKQKELIEAPKNAEIILAELTNMIYTIEETTMKINKLLERESHNG